MNAELEKWLHGDITTPKEDRKRPSNCYTIKIVYSPDVETADRLSAIEEVLTLANEVGAAYLTNHITCNSNEEGQILDTLESIQIGL